MRIKLLSSYTGKHRRQETTEELNFTPLCPWCGGFVVYHMTCETFEDNNQWWVHDSCGQAIQYYCVSYDENAGCTWSYVHGMNQLNPSWIHNENQRPTWIPLGQSNYDEEGYLWTAQGVNCADQ